MTVQHFDGAGVLGAMLWLIDEARRHGDAAKDVDVRHCRELDALKVRHADSIRDITAQLNECRRRLSMPRDDEVTSLASKVQSLEAASKDVKREYAIRNRGLTTELHNIRRKIAKGMAPGQHRAESIGLVDACLQICNGGRDVALTSHDVTLPKTVRSAKKAKKTNGQRRLSGAQKTKRR